MLVAGTEPWVLSFCASWLTALFPALLVREPVNGVIKVSAMELMKKAMARTVVALDRKVAAPLPPKTAPVIPEPPKAPASPSPLLDCNRTVIIKPAQIRICNRIKNAYKTPPLAIN